MIYVIQAIYFDPMENYNPTYTEFIGYSESEKEVMAAIAKLDSKPKYRGWDGHDYPQYKVITLEHINSKMYKEKD